MAVIGIAVSIWLVVHQLRRQRKLAAQRAALDLISRFEIHNQRWVDLRSEFVSLRNSNRLASLVKPSPEEQDENDPDKRAELRTERERKIVLVITYLNHFECVATGIRHGIIDESLYKEWLRGDYINAWDDAHSFVIDLRQRKDKENPELFVQFQRLAEKWKNEKS